MTNWAKAPPLKLKITSIKIIPSIIQLGRCLYSIGSTFTHSVFLSQSYC